MPLSNTTLCAPDREKSCFACCPPIRPAGYEHIHYRNMLKREWRENTLRFDKNDRSVLPITGFSCWALGYLDKRYRRIGCLLHPFQNQGTDLRFRVDYGGKCRREFCPESATFALLNRDAKGFWIHLADGLDSFAYSSRKENPLFAMMAWGARLLELIAVVEAYRVYNKEEFFGTYPFFHQAEAPRAHAYLLRCLIGVDQVQLLKKPSFKEEFLGLSLSLSSCLRSASEGFLGDVAVHRLPLDRDFLDFLRLSVNRAKMNLDDALALKKLADQELEKFGRTLHNL
jgi:hypothetical protein